MHFIVRQALPASGISIGISLYQYLLLVNLLERTARLLPKMKGVSSVWLIILVSIAELAFIYTRYPGYRKCTSRACVARKFLSVTLLQAYFLIMFVVVRLIVLANIFGIPMRPEVFRSGSATDLATCCLAAVVVGICQGLLLVIGPDNAAV